MSVPRPQSERPLNPGSVREVLECAQRRASALAERSGYGEAIILASEIAMAISLLPPETTTDRLFSVQGKQPMPSDAIRGDE